MKKSVILTLTGVAAATSSTLNAAERLNILMIVSDDQSQPHMGANGCPNCLKYNLTPNMDALANDAVNFQKGYVTSPHSAPSRMSFFTGVNAIRAGASRFGQTPYPDIPYFTKLLKDAGYWVGITGRSYGPNNPDVYDVSYFDLLEKGSTRDKNLPLVGSKLRSIIEKSGDKPFFLYYGTNQPHTPWPKEHPGIDPDQLVLPPDWVDTPGQRNSYARYLQAVKECDFAVGQMIQTLKDMGEYDNTLIIFFGDNGDSLPRRKCSGYNF